jgi:hypothetical protein
MEKPQRTDIHRVFIPVNTNLIFIKRNGFTVVPFLLQSFHLQPIKPTPHIYGMIFKAYILNNKHERDKVFNSGISHPILILL